MEPNSGIKPWQWAITIIIIVIILGLAGYLIYGGNKSNVNNTTGGIEQATTTTSIDSGANRITMSNQFPGNIVYVSSVNLSNGGFVVIHKDKDGEPGAVIGSEYFEPGNRPGTINLTEKTVEGSTYFAVLHSDDGDKVFDATKDLPIKDASGAFIMKSFKATVNLPEDKG